MSIILQIIFIALIGLNLFWLNSIWLGVAALAGLFFILSRRIQNRLYALIIFLSWLSLSGAFFYYTYKLTDLTIFISLAALPLIMRFWPISPIKKESNGSWLTTLLAISSLASIVAILWLGRTGQALISPWPQVKAGFFMALFILLIINFLKPSRLTNALVFITAWGVALVIYKNGFGFDPFIHQAAENYIKLHGLITPKTFYYIGHYALTLTINRATTMPIELIDSWLTPILGGLLISLTAARSLGKYAPLFLILPISFFTVTTPFSFALALLVVLIFLKLEKAPLLIQSLLALSILSIHPIVGLPALFSILWLSDRLPVPLPRLPDDQNKTRYRRKLFTAIAGGLVLPALFLMVGQFSPHWPLINWPTLFERRYDWWLELIHLFELLIWPTIIILGLLITFKKFRTHFWAFLIIAASGFFIKTMIIFPNLIAYEQDNFADRVLWIAVFIIFIPLLFWLKEIISQMSFSSRLTKSLFFTGLAILIIFATYLSYPRRDVYAVSRGWSVSDADLKTAQLIEADAQNQPYIVLANQATAAAALQKFGFRYIKSSGDESRPFEKSSASKGRDEFFFYPIPTSGRLYQFYLDIVYRQKGRAALLQAMQYAGVPQGYFAISNYWWDATKIKTSAKTWADEWFEIDDGKIMVFKIKAPSSRP